MPNKGGGTRERTQGKGSERNARDGCARESQFKWDGPPPRLSARVVPRHGGPKSRFKEYPGFAGGNKDGKRSIQRFRNLISEMVFRDRPVYRGEGERMSIMARSL